MITAIVEAGKFIARNWKVLSLVFVVSGTVGVVSVVPGTEPIREFGNQQLEKVKTHLVVSATAPEILEQ